MKQELAAEQLVAGKDEVVFRDLPAGGFYEGIILALVYVLVAVYYSHPTAATLTYIVVVVLFFARFFSLSILWMGLALLLGTLFADIAGGSISGKGLHLSYSIASSIMFALGFCSLIFTALVSFIFMLCGRALKRLLVIIFKK